jgi:hypothetical protein
MNKTLTMTATSMRSSSTRERRLNIPQTVENFHLVWLDRNITEINNDDCRNFITKLQQIITIVNTFIDFIIDINQEKTFRIISGEFRQIIIPIVGEITQESSLYMF